MLQKGGSKTEEATNGRVGEHAKVVRDIREQWSVKAVTWLCSSSAVVFEVDLRVLHAGVKWFVRKFVPLSSQKQIL